MPFHSVLSRAEDELEIDDPESTKIDGIPNRNIDNGGHDDSSFREHEMIDYDDDNKYAGSVQAALSDSNNSFLESLIEEAVPEFTFNDALSRVSVLSLLVYTHKKLVSFIHVTFQGIKDPACRVTHKLYDLYDEEDNIVDAETWDILMQPGSTITMKYRKPEAQSLSETTTKDTHQVTKPNESEYFLLPLERRLGKHNKSIYRRKLKEKAARVAKIAKTKEEEKLPQANVVGCGGRTQDKTFFKTPTKRKGPHPAAKVTRPPATHFEVAAVNEIPLPQPPTAGN